MRLVPMQLDYSPRTVREQNRRNSFELAPTAAAVGFAEIRSNFNTGSTRNKLDFADVTDDLELHALLMRVTAAG
jgi:hypothetical protein